MAERAIMLPFSITSYGSVGSTTDQKKIWADRVRSVLGTAVNERVMLPSFGTLIPYALFESDDDAQTEIQVEVEKAFAAQLPLLQLQSTEVTIDQYTGVMTVDVTYGLPNEDVVNTAVGLITISCDIPPIQELL